MTKSIKAQSVIEYVILLVVIGAALSSMALYINRAVNTQLRVGREQLSESLRKSETLPYSLGTEDISSRLGDLIQNMLGLFDNRQAEQNAVFDTSNFLNYRDGESSATNGFWDLIGGLGFSNPNGLPDTLSGLSDFANNPPQLSVDRNPLEGQVEIVDDLLEAEQ